MLFSKPTFKIIHMMVQIWCQCCSRVCLNSKKKFWITISFSFNKLDEDLILLWLLSKWLNLSLSDNLAYKPTALKDTKIEFSDIFSISFTCYKTTLVSSTICGINGVVLNINKVRKIFLLYSRDLRSMVC